MKRFRVRKSRAVAPRPSRPNRRPRPLAVSLGRFSSSLAMLAALAAGGSSAKATTLYWDLDDNPLNNVVTGGGLGGAGLWDTSTPFWWNPVGFADQAWTNNALTPDSAVFTGTTAGTITLGTGMNVGGLQFNTTAYILGAGANTNALTLGGSSATSTAITLNNVAAATINGSLLGVAGNTITIGGGVFGGVTAGTLNFAGTGTGLTGWSGATVINNGMTVSLSQNSQALSTTTNQITLNNGGITLTNVANTTPTTASITANTVVPVTAITGLQIGQTLYVGGVASGTITAISGLNVTVSAPQTITSGTSVTFSDAAVDRINNAAPILSNGGTFTVNNTANAGVNYSETVGAVTLGSGRLNVVSTNANTTAAELLTIGSLTHAAASTGIVGFSGASLGTAQNQINITAQANDTGGAGASTIIGPWATYGTAAGAQTDYATYNLTAGASNTLGVQAAAIAGSAETTWTAANNAYTLTAATALTGTRNITALKYLGAAGTLTLGTGFNLGTTGILNASTSSGTFTIAATGTGALTLPSTTSAPLFVTTGGGFGIAISAPITDNGAGALTLVASGANILTLTGANTFTGGLVLNSGTVSFNSVASPGPLGAANNTITFSGPATLTSTVAGTVPATHAIQLNNGALATFGNAAIAMNYAGNITGTGGIISNQTAGTLLTLSGTNSYTGPTIVTAGTLTAGSASAFGNNSAVTVTGVMDISAFSNSIGSLSGAGGVTLGANTLTIGGNNENTAYSGIMAGTNGLFTKTGTGILTLTGTSTFTGVPNLNAGLVNITALANLGAAASVNFNGGGIQLPLVSVLDPSTRTLVFNAGGGTLDTNSNIITLANAIGGAGAGGFTKAGVGTLFLPVANTYKGVTSVSGGTLVLQNDGAVGTVAGSLGVTVGSGASVVLPGGRNLASTVPLNLSGAGFTSALQNGALVSVGSNTAAGLLTLGASATVDSESGTLISPIPAA